MRINRQEKKIILECLENIWNTGWDREYYYNEPKKEQIREKLINKYIKELKRKPSLSGDSDNK